MCDYGVYKGDSLILVAGTKEKAEEMALNYEGASVFPVINNKGKWEKKR